MNNFRTEDFEFEEDGINGQECSDCGTYYDADESTESSECEECGGELLNYTYHEGQECCVCNRELDVYEDCYANSDNLMCVSCFSELEGKEEED